MQSTRSFIKADRWPELQQHVSDQRKGVPAPPLEKACPQAAMLVDLPHPDTLVVGPGDYFDARQILNSVSIVVAGSSDVEKPAGNPLSGMLNLEVSPHVDSGKWFVLATQHPVRPLLLQWRIKPEFTAVTDPSDNAPRASLYSITGMPIRDASRNSMCSDTWAATSPTPASTTPSCAAT